MKKEHKEALEVLLKAPIMLAACCDALQKGIQLKSPEKVDTLIDELEKAVPILEDLRAEWNVIKCCQECRFWDQFYHDESSGAGAGHCVRYAPRPVIGKVGSDAEENVVWPITRENQVCGEFSLPNATTEARHE